MNKSDFPIFANNPWLIYLDNAASTQKPQYVIDGVSEFVASSYANIHRGLYAISEKSEEVYYASKAKYAQLINCKSSEIIYSYNATYCINLLAQALCASKKLGKGDSVLLGIWDHHANIVPRQSLALEYGFTIKFIASTDAYEIDRADFDRQYTPDVKVVSCAHVSNVTGAIYEVDQIKPRLRPDTFFIIDGSQAIPNFTVDVMALGCDAYVSTAHKIMAYTGLGMLYLQKPHVKTLRPLIAGGWSISDVDTEGYTISGTASSFEAGTPNIIAAVSLLKALEYIDQQWGIDAIWEHEQRLVKYALPKFKSLEDQGKLHLVGPYVAEKRVWAFSFVLPSQENTSLVGEEFAHHDICVRCGGHCAYPLHKSLQLAGTCRMSVYGYNEEGDIDRFFEVLEGMVK